ncbi:two-component system response regulator KdpE [Roseateles sp. BYS180W]|uniref:Two-component system response regulator KdpE n=1 Tax=Roseateles rivi TaxID=3299028 RepID=A0ABW7FXL8_9BURK
MIELRPTALIVEDEPNIRRFVRLALEAEGWQVHECESVRQGLIDAGTRHPELIILDLGLPDDDGLNYLKDLRSWSSVPVIVLSARADERDKIAALDAGADDYLTKPFGVGELMARVRVAQRRTQAVAAHSSQAAAASRFCFGAVEVDLAARRVLRDGQAVHLTPTEYRLLTHLITHAGKVLTHRQLLKAVWGPSHVEDSHYLRVYMGQLRHKLEAEPAQPRHLLTETAVGYRLMP